MSYSTRAKTVLEAIAGRAITNEIGILYVNSVVEERHLDPTQIEGSAQYDPNNPLGIEDRSALFLQWLKRILKQHRASAAAKEKLQEAENIKEATMLQAEAELQE